MTQEYRILSGMTENKPIDMVSLMRRIRSGKVTPNTLILIGDSETPVPAGEIKELARFFIDTGYDPMDNSLRPRSITLSKALDTGWHFVMESNIMTVYAGGMLILMLMFALAMVSQFGMYVGGFIAWCVFMVTQQLYFMFTVRVFRGQTIGQDFMNHQFTPILSALVLFSILYAVLLPVGLALLIVPGLLFATFFTYVPIVLMDKQVPISKAFASSFQRVSKAGIKQIIAVSTILALHYICLFLIVPVPLTMPLFFAALIEMYEKNSI